MFPTDKILTICIPTYNRLKLLEECINSIIAQIDENIISKIEICVFDNASTDGTQEYCEELLKQYSYLKYTRNLENIGPDGNFYKILRFQAKSLFKQLLSDDDKYAPDSLKGLLEFLDGNIKQNFVYLNYAQFKSEDSDNLFNPLCPSSFTLINLSKLEFIDIVKNEYSFLSSMVFNCGIINLIGIDKFTNTNWLQSYALFNSTVNSENLLAFYGPITVHKRSDDIMADYNMFKVFGTNYYALAKFAYEKCGYDKKQLLQLVSKRWKKILYWARLNRIDSIEYKEIIEICKTEKNLKSVIKYGKIPHWVCAAYHRFKCLVKK